MENATEFLWGHRSLKNDIFIKSPGQSDKRKESSHTYASFGDKGTTVSINAYGHIMQMSCFLGFGASGFLCVDSQLPEPYYVQSRMEELLSSSQDPNRGLRLGLVDWSKYHALSSGFMYDRWPRYVFDRVLPTKSERSSKKPDLKVKTTRRPHDKEDNSATGPVPVLDSPQDGSVPSKETNALLPSFALSIQYYCHEDTVVQKYQIRVGDGGMSHDEVKWGKLSLMPNVCIRSLNFVESLNFDDNEANLETFIITESSLMIVHTIPEEHFEEENEHTDRNKPDQQQVNDVERPLAAALIISPFINDRPASIVEGTCIELENIAGESRLVITVAYTLKLLYSDSIELRKPPEPAPFAANDREATSYIEREIPGTPTQLDAANGLTQNTDLPEQEKQTTDVTTEQKIVIVKGTEKPEEWAAQVMIAMREMGEVFCETSSFRRICFSQNDQLDFAFRRNLEHMLSVCSIPIPIAQNTVPVALRGPAIAITCGDIAGHRIGPRASLAIYQFLCLLLVYIDPEKVHELRYKRVAAEPKQSKIVSGGKTPENMNSCETTGTSSRTEAEDTEHRQAVDTYLAQLYSRVFRVLEGHIVWICAKADYSRHRSFNAHHWPNGHGIIDLNYLPEPSLVDTPLQLIKVLYYNKLPAGSGKKKQNWMRNQLEPKVKSWIKYLHSINGRSAYAFYDEPATPRPWWQQLMSNGYNGDNPKYRLTDHVMIGVALEAVRDIVVHQTKSHFWPYYSHKEVQSKILKRFTTENPISKQRMLATSRWKDETRFLLHSKDTFLFSTEGLEYLQDRVRASIASKRDQKGYKYDESVEPWKYADLRWAKLLDAQAYHDDFQLLEWDNPLWYALVFILACKGTRVNNETPEKLIHSSRSVLLGTASYNGLFAGQLGRKNVPEAYSLEYQRDDYWFRTFEIAHILWNFFTVDEPSPVLGKHSMPPSKSPSTTGSKPGPKEATRVGQQVEKRVPFTSVGPAKDRMDVTTLSDDWLQAPPAFLEFATKPDSTIIDPCFGQDMGTISDRSQRLGSKVVGAIIEIPKWSPGTEISNPQLTAYDLYRKLQRQTVWESKKRIIWLPSFGETPAVTVAQKILHVSSPIEKESGLAFIGRNLKGEKYFLDSATAALNEWETELHLSFFSISNTNKSNLYELESHNFLMPRTISIRFSGDFSDRYWICYFLEPQTSKTWGNTLGERLLPREDCGIRGGLGLSASDPALEVFGWSEPRRKTRSPRSWQQRKVLELLIYSKMLEELRENTNNIFRAVKRLALHSHDDKGPVNSFQTAIEEADQLQQLGEKEDYVSIAKDWRRYIQILTVVEENLIDNIEKIDQWERREDDRQSQQPRWTDRDKRDHFTTMLRLTILTQRQASEIKRLRNDVRTFRDSLPSQLASIREDISFRGSRNINLFTYVTVVFLPLGFATGALSMNGPPNHTLLMNLVFLSLAAFGLTLFALINARYVKIVLPLFLHLPQRLIRYTIFNYIVVPVIHHLVQRKQKKLQNKEQHIKSQNGIFANPQVNTVQPTTTITISQSSSGLDSKGLAGRSQGDQQAPKPRRSLRAKYHEVKNFSILAAARNEERKQNAEPLEKKDNADGAEDASIKTHRGLDRLLHHRKPKQDLEKGDRDARKIESGADSDQSSIFPSDFFGMEEDL